MATAIYPTADPFVPETGSLQALRSAIPECKGCPLYRHATQAVFGAGPKNAPIILVGEQPGNEEDLQGLPFVGPAGRLLDRALQSAGIERDAVYVTNAVKHFKFEDRGKRRLHKKPTSGEVQACRPWLDAEVRAIKPHVLVCLGATAAQSILGRKFLLTADRGKAITHAIAPHVVPTVHPSAILRIPEQSRRHAEFDRLVADFKMVRGLLH